MNVRWLSGFWEGEGSVGCYDKTSQQKHYRAYPTMVLSWSITQKEKWPLRKIKEYLGYGSLYKNRASGVNGVPIWGFACYNANTYKVIKKIRQHLISPRRKRQIAKALRIWKQFKRDKAAKKEGKE